MESVTMLGSRAVALAVCFAALGARLGAQITEVARTPIADAAQLTFGHLCDDRFVNPAAGRR